MGGPAECESPEKRPSLPTLLPVPRSLPTHKALGYGVPPPQTARPAQPGTQPMPRPGKGRLLPPAPTAHPASSRARSPALGWASGPARPTDGALRPGREVADAGTSSWQLSRAAPLRVEQSPGPSLRYWGHVNPPPPELLNKMRDSFLCAFH